VHHSGSVQSCLIPFWVSFPITPDSLLIVLLSDNVDEDVYMYVGMCVVVCDMSRPTECLVSMVIGKCGVDLST